jgi:hypothetical protein
MTFLSNHCEAIAAMDSFTVPTLTFGVLYFFFVIAHNRRRILQFNVTSIRQAHGSFSSSARHFRTIRHRDILSLIAVQTSIKK